MDTKPSSPAERFPEVTAILRSATPRAWVTPTIAGLLVACFVGSVLLGAHPISPTTRQLVEVGASFGPLVVEGQWWRLLAAHRALHASLETARIRHTCAELPGGHDWAFWERETPRLLAFIADSCLGA